MAYTGRIVRGKNLDVLVDLWPMVMSRVGGARLILVGAGVPGDPVEEELRRKVQSNSRLNGSVTLTGWVPDVTPYLEHADVFVFPSDSEGMSNALLEACALGRVVVASDIPPNRAVLGEDYPLLFDAADEQQFESAVISGLVDEALRSQARTKVLSRIAGFGVGSVVDQIEEHLTT